MSGFARRGASAARLHHNEGTSDLPVVPQRPGPLLRGTEEPSPRGTLRVLGIREPSARGTDTEEPGRMIRVTRLAEGTRFAEARNRMVAEQIVARGVKDPLVLAAMRSVPRHEFVPGELKDAAYRDSPLPIGDDQTISQPYIVALMTEASGLEGGEKVLEVGTGSGYQSAVLDEIAGTVLTIEIMPTVAERARANLDRLGYNDVRLRVGDGYRGWVEEGPFDVIVVTAAPDHVPRPLLDQLKPGGRLVLPVGRSRQKLQVWTKTDHGFEQRDLIPVSFVPMTGEARGEEAPDPNNANQK
jgi:protein-L-isoaspartate(D-aspartate) O-methyltransferase